MERSGARSALLGVEINEMSSRLQVMKFGGTSVGDAACIARTTQIVAAAAKQNPCIAVVSAMSGVTNRLIAAAQKAATGDSNEGGELVKILRAQHATALEILLKDPEARKRVMKKLDAVLSEAKRLCDGTALLRELTPERSMKFPAWANASPRRWWPRP